MKTIIICAGLLGGILFPYGHSYVFLIRYFLMVMLFFSFLDVKFDKNVIRFNHFIILFATVGISIAIFLIINPFHPTLAQAAFTTAIAPTAISAPVVISLKKGKVEFVMFSLLLSNLAIALLVPFLLPALMHSSVDISVNKVLLPVIITIFVPLLLAQAVKYFLRRLWNKLVGMKDISFYIMVVNVYIATSDASNYIRSSSANELGIVFMIAFTSALLCILLFSLGWIIGRKEFAVETSQALGQKNNTFTIWLSLTFVNPIATLGPIFYVFMQNIYISWELYHARHQEGC